MKHHFSMLKTVMTFWENIVKWKIVDENLTCIIYFCFTNGFTKHSIWFFISYTYSNKYNAHLRAGYWYCSTGYWPRPPRSGRCVLTSPNYSSSCPLRCVHPARRLHLKKNYNSNKPRFIVTQTTTHLWCSLSHSSPPLRSFSSSYSWGCQGPWRRPSCAGLDLWGRWGSGSSSRIGEWAASTTWGAAREISVTDRANTLYWTGSMAFLSNKTNKTLSTHLTYILNNDIFNYKWAFTKKSMNVRYISRLSSPKISTYL